MTYYVYMYIYSIHTHTHTRTHIYTHTTNMYIAKRAFRTLGEYQGFLSSPCHHRKCTVQLL